MSVAEMTLQETARRMAEEARDAEEGLVRTYWFPDPNNVEVRLVHVDRTGYPSNRVEPFYFGRNIAYGQPFRSAIALVRPESDRQIPLPDGWGRWEDATVWEWQ